MGYRVVSVPPAGQTFDTPSPSGRPAGVERVTGTRQAGRDASIADPPGFFASVTFDALWQEV